ncbi:rRNA pseudouridine synthase [Canibacter sp. lx-45]|nr:rRNA pseudouridine synthase [Canibacter zhuwentaonis]
MPGHGDAGDLSRAVSSAGRSGVSDLVGVGAAADQGGGLTASEGVRLQKALAGAGVASRRACESLIVRGKVRVNGEIVCELGTRINPAQDEIRVNGIIVQLDVTKRYFILNKPRGIVATMADEQGRPDLTEFTAAFEERIYNVGRLDTDTSGLLILTNDGELAHALAHPRFGVEKTYVAKVRGRVAPATVQLLKSGIELADGEIAADSAKVLPGLTSDYSLLEITLHSGRNRIVRRMLAAVGHPVVELVRRQFGPLHLGNLAIGQMRELSEAERGVLLTLAAGSVKGAPKRKISAGRPGDGVGAGCVRAGRQGGGSRASRQHGGADRPRTGGRSGGARIRSQHNSARAGGKNSGARASGKPADGGNRS